MSIQIRGDDYVTKVILCHFVIFEHIHPNVITIFGIILNITIFYTAENNNFFFTAVLLIFRYLADCLDGGVARKYNKTSKIGGSLDTFSDNMLIFFYVIIMCNMLDIPGGISAATFFVVLNLYMMFLSNSLINHSGIKVGGNSVKNIYAFFVNNSYILFIIKIASIYLGMYTAVDF
jgi:phosphatidylglycerophosphate synthase